MTPSERRLIAALTIVVVGATLLLPPAANAQAESGIPVGFVESTGDIDTATGDGWADIQTATVPLSSAGAAVPNANDVTVEEVEVAAARTNRRLYLRASWADPSQDTSADSVRSFADNMAVQLPTTGDDQPPIAMGGPDNPVNVWYWSASGDSEELQASGPGSTTPFAESTVTTDQSYADGRWHVLFSRPLDPAGDGRTTIPRDSADMDVAFAVWNGSNAEVAGQKSVSQWQRLAVSSGPPTYQRLLWAVAGVLIVVTTLVTIEGLRRTGGE